MVSETRFTPGPWRFVKGESNVPEINPMRKLICFGSIMEPEEELHIAEIWADGPRNREANAALIAASPDLFEALEELVGANEKWNADVQTIIERLPTWTDQYLDRAREVLKKARGEQ